MSGFLLCDSLYYLSITLYTRAGYGLDHRYKDNAREQGTYVWQDGTYFTGTFKNNDVCKGKIYDVNGNLLQEFTGNEKH